MAFWEEGDGGLGGKWGVFMQCDSGEGDGLSVGLMGRA